MSFLEVRDLCVDLKEFRLKNIHLNLEKGDYLTIIGPTGAGKTILLESIIGFHRLEKGRIFIDGKEVTDELPENRKTGIVYQDYALLPHFDIRKNIEYGLKKKYKLKSDKELIDEKIETIAEALNISHLLGRTPGTLSGGEQQRAALARALVVEPRLLLMDEPLSALDPLTRKKTRRLLKKIISDTDMTVIHITHDLEDVWSFANKVSVFKDGEQMQFGSLDEVFKRPKNEFVASFVGACMHSCIVEDCGKDVSTVNVNGLRLYSSDVCIPETEARIAIRPENIIIHEECPKFPDCTNCMNLIRSELVDVTNDGTVCTGLVSAQGTNLEVIIPHEKAQSLMGKIGTHVYTFIQNEHVRVIQDTVSGE